MAGQAGYGPGVRKRTTNNVSSPFAPSAQQSPLVAEKKPAELHADGKFLVRQVDTMFEQLETNASRLALQFEATAVLDYPPSCKNAVDLLKERMTESESARGSQT